MNLPKLALLVLAGLAPLPNLLGQETTEFAKLLADGKQKALAHEWQTALDLLNAAVKLSPDNVEGLRWRGHAYTGSKQYEKALQDLDRAVDLVANDSWTQYARAMALHHLARYDEAVLGYTLAHKLDPKFSKPLEWRGFTLSLLGEHVRSLADIQQAIAQNRGNTWLWFIRAKTYVALLDYAHAEEDFWRVVDAEEDNADAHAQLGYLCACNGDRVTARNMLKRAVKLAPESQVEARSWLFHIYTARDETELAKAQLDAVFAADEKDGVDAKALRWPQQIARHLSGELSAKELIRLAAAESPSADELRGRQCEAWLHIGLMHHAGGHQSEALLALAHAVATDARDKWEWSWARRHLTEICYPEK